MQVLLYTRVGCHLCEDAKALLLRHGLTPQEIDIDHDHDLRQQYDECVPVVVMDGKVRFRGRVDERLLLRLLKARSRG
jgi:glutaredoxin